MHCEFGLPAVTVCARAQHRDVGGKPGGKKGMSGERRGAALPSRDYLASLV
jgi:hypothetical protein